MECGKNLSKIKYALWAFILGFLLFWPIMPSYGESIDKDPQNRFQFGKALPPNKGFRTDTWWNITADVWGYYNQTGQPYYRTYHYVNFNQKTGDDFLFWINNVTYWGEDSYGQIVYNKTIVGSTWESYYFDEYSEYEDVYVAYTKINVTVWDTVYSNYIPGDETYSVNLIALVSRRDVVISNVTASPTEVYQGQDVNITVVVENLGAVNETFDVTVYRNDTKIGNQTVSDLPPGNQTTLTFIWHVDTSVPAGNYIIKANASVVPYEKNATNNIKTDGTVKVKQVGGCPYVST